MVATYALLKLLLFVFFLAYLRDLSAERIVEKCIETRPPGSIYSCAQQRNWGKCDAPWMQKANYCAVTCGFCSAPTTLPEILFQTRTSQRLNETKKKRQTQKRVIKSLLPRKKDCDSVLSVLSQMENFSFFAQLLEKAIDAERRQITVPQQQQKLESLLSGNTEQTLTIFVPQNNAFDSTHAFNQLDNESLLKFIGNHIIRGAHSSRSLINSPDRFPTYGEQEIWTYGGPNGVFSIGNRAHEGRVLFKDVRLCNGFLHFIDGALDVVFSSI